MILICSLFQFPLTRQLIAVLVIKLVKMTSATLSTSSPQSRERDPLNKTLCYIALALWRRGMGGCVHHSATGLSEISSLSRISERSFILTDE